MAVACSAAAAPVLSPYGDFKWAITAAFVCLAVIRSRVRASVPLPFRLMSIGLLVGVLPFAWTLNLEDLRLPLTEAAFFYAAGGCGFEFRERDTTRRVRLVVLALAAVTVLQAIGVMTRYGQDPFSTVRLSWNLTGLLAALAAVAAVGCMPGVAATVVALASVAIVAASGSRDAMLFTGVGVLLIVGLSRGVMRRMILIGSLCAALGAGMVVIGRVVPDAASDPVLLMRVWRSVTFDNADRAESWGVWWDKCIAAPEGTGMATTGDGDLAKVGSHNAWLDLWARGGVPCAVLFTMGQIWLMAGLLRSSSLGDWRALSVALAVAASIRMLFEVLPLSTSYGMNGLLVLFVGGIALSHRPPAALHGTVRSVKTMAPLRGRVALGA